jgi:ATP synthase protein I
MVRPAREGFFAIARSLLRKTRRSGSILFPGDAFVEGVAMNKRAGEDEVLAERLEGLGEALAERDRAKRDAPSASPPVGNAMAVGMRAMSELVAAVMFGAGLGWAMDRGLGSEPWGVVLGLTVGTAAGFWGVYRLAARTGASGVDKAERK